MAIIKRVSGMPRYAVDILLQNGSNIILELEPYLNEPRFADLLEDDRILYPHTDGEVLYWKDGPTLAMEEVFALLKRNETNNTGEKEGMTR